MEYIWRRRNKKENLDPFNSLINGINSFYNVSTVYIALLIIHINYYLISDLIEELQLYIM